MEYDFAIPGVMGGNRHGDYENPGSAYPLQTEISDSALEMLNGFDASDVWYEFEDDDTLRCVEKLFKELLGKELNGVICRRIRT